jgi:hypothetical protein
MLELHLDLAQAYSVVDDYAGVEACSVHVAAFERAFNFCAAPFDVGLRDLLHERRTALGYIRRRRSKLDNREASSDEKRPKKPSRFPSLLC